MKAGIIGFGSIGRRHVMNLLKAGITDIVLFRELNKGNELSLREVHNIDDFLNEAFDFIILANPTSLHARYLEMILQRNINVLVEKPVVLTSGEVEQVLTSLSGYRGIGMVAFNLRYHPCVKKAMTLLKQNSIGEIYHGRFFVGQYLPDWRPGTDYRLSYSASKQLGGGVIMDLIHEIDLALYFCNEPSGSMMSFTGQLGKLGIETEDIAEITYLSSSRVLVNIHMDYLTRGFKRDFCIFGNQGWIAADLYNNKCSVYKNGEGWEDFIFPDFERNDMYLDLIKGFINCVSTQTLPPVGLVEGLNVSRIACKVKESTL